MPTAITAGSGGTLGRLTSGSTSSWSPSDVGAGGGAEGRGGGAEARAGGRSDGVPTEMMRWAKMLLDLGGLAAADGGNSSGTVGTLSRGGESLGRGTDEGPATGASMTGWERGRGTDGRPPVGVSLALKAPASLANASLIERNESPPLSAAATASLGGEDGSWNEMAGVLGDLSEPRFSAASVAAGGLEPGWLESRFGFGGGASLRDVGATESWRGGGTGSGDCANTSTSSASAPVSTRAWGVASP
jgi:hypothetical protein